ncbi:NAD(P)H-dependent oxidoreductase [Methanoregula formicica]|uniref:Putative NADPH-quinone reductase (Modulator of drug activity B) n=1 Tax=Methanoregula formicica (strain DSM 22288 / NBRC 105244 / SMSP) TaxID=593750 RepID=L0HEB3_METFS|nr:NAD(P)H-dependent oxidoreductase [Methanoregula formicica]AGB01434.1 putative NADPH-quinone reductase (modulator of drug activity B) [Methanoregula formicica SMSP]
MKISLILAHPRPGSFNHAIAGTAARVLHDAGHIVSVHDLYAEAFDPLLLSEEVPRDTLLPDDIAQHCAEIASADGIVIVHPDWWGMPPAILKGWIDRVLRPGVAYRFAETDSGDGIPAGLLKAKAAIVFNTSNTPWQREIEIFGDPLERLWKDCVLVFCGVPVVQRRMFGVVVTSTDAQRKAWLEEVSRLVSETFPQESSA